MGVAAGSAGDYSPEWTNRVRATCLTLAQILGEDLINETVVVGGFVPTLLYDAVTPIPDTGPHVGTRDLDLALDLVILEEERYETVVDRLANGGFHPDKNESGNLTRQRWLSADGATVDFLMPPVPPDTHGGRQQNLTMQFAAFTMRGLDLALKTAVTVPLAGPDLTGRQVERRLRVCAPDVFVALKAFAIAGRDNNKDAYDLYFVLKHDGALPAGLGAQLAGRNDDFTLAAVERIRGYFDTIDGRGPRDVCSFLGRDGDDELAADVLAYARAFVQGYGLR